MESMCIYAVVFYCIQCLYVFMFKHDVPGATRAVLYVNVGLLVVAISSNFEEYETDTGGFRVRVHIVFPEYL